MPRETTATSRRGWVALGVVIFVAVIAAAGFIALSNSGVLAPHHDIKGTFTLLDSDTEFPSIKTAGSTCVGTGGYDDVGPGQPVTLRDGDGKILAASILGSGQGNLSSCAFEFRLAGVPEAAFYSVEVGRRGQISSSLADMEASGWTFGLTLGK